MIPAADELRRRDALGRLALLDTAPEREFDAAVSLATRLLGKPLAAITFVDGERTWLKAWEGLDERELARERSYCHWTIRDDAPFTVEDGRQDSRFAALVAAEALPPFYAGTPIHAPSGERIGALCVLDHRPGRLDDADVQALEDLGLMVDALIAARATARDALEIAVVADGQASRLARQERVLSQAQRMAMIGSWRLPLDTVALELSENAGAICGLDPVQSPHLSDLLARCAPAARAEITGAMTRAIESGVSLDLEVDISVGGSRRVRIIGEVEIEKGRPVALVGVLQDVSERRALEAMLRRSADTDALTGLANRAAFDRALEEAMARSGGGSAALLLVLIDLDDFKGVNDTHGHLAGDDVLRAIGQRLGEIWLKGSLAARLGGDEFAIIVEDPALAADAAGLAARLEESLAVPVRSEGRLIPCAGTVGVARHDGDCRTVRDFVHRADAALYALKRSRSGERRRSERRAAG